MKEITLKIMNNKFLVYLGIAVLTLFIANIRITYSGLPYYYMNTTTIYQQTANETLLNSCGDPFSCTFNIVPYFAYLLMLLAFGIAYIRGHKLSVGFLGATLIGITVLAVELSVGTSYNSASAIVGYSIVLACGVATAASMYAETLLEPN